MSGLIVLFWFVGGGVALRYLVNTFFMFKSKLIVELQSIAHRCFSSGSCHACTFYGMS